MNEPMKSAQAAQSTDRIERSIDIQAPPARVWRALADAQEFGTWFDALPAARRAEAFRMNSRGWDAQMDNIARHVAA